MNTTVILRAERRRLRRLALALLATLGLSAADPTPAATGGDTGNATSAPAASPSSVDLDALRARLSAPGQTTGLLFLSPEERRVAFGHVAAVLPTRPIPASPRPLTLTPAPIDFSAVTYVVDGITYTLADFLALPGAIGLAVAQDDRLLFEHYAPGHDQTTPWISFSVAKSVTSMLIGAAIADGFIASVDEPVTNYLPRLRGSPYDTATIRHVLNMASGVAWNEDYASPESDVAKAGAANGLT
ncbi:MAG: serine hydrolase, partial [Gammaproteobacteria bacterium]